MFDFRFNVIFMFLPHGTNLDSLTEQPSSFKSDNKIVSIMMRSQRILDLFWYLILLAHVFFSAVYWQIAWEGLAAVIISRLSLRLSHSTSDISSDLLRSDYPKYTTF